MSQKQWQQPTIKQLNIKETESGDVDFVAEGQWVSEDNPGWVITTHS